MRYLSEEVADDDVGQGVSQTAQLMGNHKSDQFFFFHFRRFLFCFKWMSVTLCAAQSIHPSAHGLMLMSSRPSTMLG